MGRGVSRRRRFLCGMVLLLAALIAVVLWPEKEESAAPVSDADSAAATLGRRHDYDGEHGENASQRKRRPAGQHRSQEERHRSRWESENAPAQNPPYGPPVAARERKRIVVELNSADSSDLVQLYNIGPAFARRILRYRERLGGFVNEEQLKEVYGMDSARYYSLLPQVRIDSAAVKKIDLNRATIDELKRHPYLDYYQAKAIVRLREERGPYGTPADLQQITIIEKETYQKIAPYITCSLPQKK